jgi:hypothetical protein
MALSVSLWRRDFTAELATPRMTFAVMRHSWRAIGGPHQATIRATGDLRALWELIETLRYPIELVDEHGEPRWWGYVAEAEVRVEGIAISVSLDSMANRVAVAYAYTTEQNPSGERATTAYAQDDTSVDEYGTIERLESSASDDTETAVALRDSVLEALRWPQPQVRIEPGGREIQATLYCRGWWDTLRWRMYDNAGIDVVETTTQVEEIIDELGEFIEGVLIETASGVQALEYRDGDTNAQAEIEALMGRGTSNDRRVLAEVTRERYVRLYEEPASGSGDYLLLADGTLHDAYDNPLPPGACVAGVWARLKDVLPATIDTTRLTDPALVFIEECEWDEENYRIGRIEPRGPSVMSMGEIEPR